MTINAMPRSFEFNEIMEALKSFMISVNGFNDVNWSGSAAQALLRVLAYNTQMQQVGNNFIYNELDITTATKRESVASIASGTLGYLPGSATCSKLFVDVVVEPSSLPSPASIVLSRTTNFFSAKDGQAFNFSPKEDYEVAFDNGFYRFIGVELLQGDWVSEAWPVQTDSGIESYVLSNSEFIDIKTLSVGVLPSASATSIEKYKQVEAIYDLGPNEKSYFVTMNNQGNYVITFGDDRLARKLRFGEVVVVDYMTTAGTEGDGIKEITLAGDIGGYYDVTTEIDAHSEGGGYQEGIETIRRAAPMAFAGQGSAVSSRDFVSLVSRLLPGSVVASWGGEDYDPPKPGFQIIAVKPNTANSLSSMQKAALTTEVTKYCVGSISPYFVDPEFTFIDISSKVLYQKGKTILDARALRTKLVDFLKKYSKSNLELFGSDFIYSNLVGAINSADPSFYGNVTGVTFKKFMSPELGAIRSYPFNFSASIKPGSVLIDQFTILDSDFEGWSYKIADNGAGILKLIKTHVDTRVSTFDGDFGTVDYETGRVQIDRFRPIKVLGSEGVKISVSPSSNDPSLYTSGKSIIKVDKIDLQFEDRAST